MQCYESITKQYDGIFRPRVDETEEGTGQPDEQVEERFEDYYGWLLTLDAMSNNDRTKWDYFGNMKVIEFLNTLTYYKVKQDWMNEKLKNNG